LPLELDPSSEEGDKLPTISGESTSATMMDISESDWSAPLPENNKRVLVVDRQSLTKEALCDQIRAWGLDAMACNDVQEAIRILKDAYAMGLPFQGMYSSAQASCFLLYSL
jgi:ABC-type enterochelin transport system substrate-binding protein